jgi:uncharacterized Zn finger protein
VEQLVFQVKGSSPEPYEVTFIKDGTSLTALCTCPAGQFGGICKHRVAILEGKTRGVASDNADQLATVGRWLVGTDVEASLAELKAAQKNRETSMHDIAALKRKLARAMHS